MGVDTLYVHASGAETATGQSAAFDTTHITSAALDVNLTALTGGTAPTLTFSLQRLGADGVWYTAWTQAAAMSATGPASFELGPSSPAAQLVIFTTQARLVWTFGGTAPPTSVAFSASLIGRS